MRTVTNFLKSNSIIELKATKTNLKQINIMNFKFIQIRTKFRYTKKNQLAFAIARDQLIYFGEQ